MLLCGFRPVPFAFVRLYLPLQNEYVTHVIVTSGTPQIFLVFQTMRMQLKACTNEDNAALRRMIVSAIRTEKGRLESGVGKV